MNKGFVPDRPHLQDTPIGTQQPEDELDALLHKVEAKKAQKEREVGEDQPDVVGLFRTRMRQVYLPIFEELRDKYAAKGIHMDLDADEFFGGGTSLKMKFVYGELSMELDGTVMRNGVAFYIVRGVGKSKGAMFSGPMLRLRNLSADDFRHFVVDQLGTLIKDALRQA